MSRDEVLRWVPQFVDLGPDVNCSVLYTNGQRDTKTLSSILNWMLRKVNSGGGGGGGADGTVVIEKPAGVNILGGMACVVNNLGMIVPASKDNQIFYENQVGIADDNYTSGSTAKLVVAGAVTWAGWNFTIGEEIYIMNNGNVSTTIPVAPDMFWIIGRSIASDTIIVAPEIPINL